MGTRRLLAVTLALVAPLALTGCLALPPAVGTAPTIGVESPLPSEPAEPPSTSDPAPSSEAPDSPEPTESAEASETPAPSDPGIPTGSTVTIDGQPAGAWSGTVRCTLVGTGGAFASTADDGTGAIFGNLAEAEGGWLASAVIVNEGEQFYVQADATAPATIEGEVLTLQVTVIDPLVAGPSVTVAVTSPCARA